MSGDLNELQRRAAQAEGAYELCRVAHRLYEADAGVISVRDMLDALDDYVAQMQAWAVRAVWE